MVRPVDSDRSVWFLLTCSPPLLPSLSLSLLPDSSLSLFHLSTAAYCVPGPHLLAEVTMRVSDIWVDSNGATANLSGFLKDVMLERETMINLIFN